MSASVVATPELLMTMTDIAGLAEVSRPAVTKWRTRYPDFPAPAGGDEAPAVRPARSADWLQQPRGTEAPHDHPGTGRTGALPVHAGRPGPFLSGRRRPGAVTALICLRRLAGEFTPVADGVGDPVAAARALAARFDPNDAVVLTEIRSIPTGAGWLVREVDHLVEASWNAGTRSST